MPKPLSALLLALLLIGCASTQLSARRNIVPQTVAQSGQVCPTQPAVMCIAVTVTPGVSPTPTDSIITRTAVPSATASAQPSPTMIQTIQPGTNVPATPLCRWEAQGAVPAVKQTFYTYTDPQRYGISQNVRGGPGTDFLIVEYLSKGAKVRVYWSLSRGSFKWWALDVTCSRWAAELGTIEVITD